MTALLGLACWRGISNFASILMFLLPSAQLAFCRATNPLKCFSLKTALLWLFHRGLPFLVSVSAPHPLTEKTVFLKNEISNQILMLRFLLYTEPLFVPNRASFCSKWNRFLLQSGILKWISAWAYKEDLTLSSFWSIWFFQGLLGVLPKSWSPMSCALWRVLPNERVANLGYYWLEVIRNIPVSIRSHLHRTNEQHFTHSLFAADWSRLLLFW